MKARTVLAALALLGIAEIAQAAERPENPRKQTEAGLYLTATEAAAMKAESGDAVLFIDVRDPVEIMFTGFAEPVDANIPFKIANPAGWNAERSGFPMENNSAFLDTVEKVLSSRGLDKNDPILTMCRSGARSAVAANALAKAGFARVYSVVDGFEGDVDARSKIGPVRSVNGWKNSGLPWTTKLDRRKFHLPPTQ